jgi:hypothetical protein
MDGTMSDTKYIAFDDVKALDAKAAEINAAYLDEMAQKLGRLPGETIDSVIDNGTGAIVRPADRIITTGLVEPKVFEGVTGGVIAVDAALVAAEAGDPELVKDAKTLAELDPKWAAAVAAAEAGAAQAATIDIAGDGITAELKP